MTNIFSTFRAPICWPRRHGHCATDGHDTGLHCQTEGTLSTVRIMFGSPRSHAALSTTPRSITASRRLNQCKIITFTTQHYLEGLYSSIHREMCRASC